MLSLKWDELLSLAGENTNPTWLLNVANDIRRRAMVDEYKVRARCGYF